MVPVTQDNEEKTGDRQKCVQLKMHETHKGKQLEGAKAVWTPLHCALPASRVSADTKAVLYPATQDFSKGIVFSAQEAKK